jgi:hypothetical protein
MGKSTFVILVLVLAAGLLGMACVGPAKTTESPSTTGANASTSANASTFTWIEAYRVGGDNYSGFSTATIRDQQATSDFTYQEEQSFWIGSDSGGLDGQVATYHIRFLGNDYGIPVCTQANRTGDGGWRWCSDNIVERTDRHRVKIRFMDSGWVITQMKPPTGPLVNSSGVANGGEIKLAKETNYSILANGEQIDAGAFKLRFKTISGAVGPGNLHPAVFDVMDADGNVLEQAVVTPGETYTYTQPSTGRIVKFHVYQTASGLTLGAYWAEMAVYSDEITLQDGQPLDLAPEGDPNHNVKVSLLWKNRDNGGQNSTLPDSLREIVLYDADSFRSRNMTPGETYYFPPAKPAYRLTYTGQSQEGLASFVFSSAILPANITPHADGFCPVEGWTVVGIDEPFKIGNWTVTYLVWRTQSDCPQNKDGLYAGVFEVLDENNESLGQYTICPNSTLRVNRTSDNRSVNLRVLGSAEGFSLSAGWAQVWGRAKNCSDEYADVQRTMPLTKPQ